MPAPQPRTPVTVLMDFIQPGFPFARVYSVFFLERELVFSRTGLGGTNAAGTLRGSLGGWSPAALIAGALGALADMFRSDRRVEKTVAAQRCIGEGEGETEDDFTLPYDSITRVEVRGPNFVREIKVILWAGEERRFRIDRQTEGDAQRIRQVFERFLPGRVTTGG